MYLVLILCNILDVEHKNTHTHTNSVENMLSYVTSGEGKTYRRIEKINSEFLAWVCAQIYKVQKKKPGKRHLQENHATVYALYKFILLYLND